MSTHCNTDLAVVGAGPAGLALAAEALELGASVTLVDPAPDRPFEPTWCAFAADLPPDVPVLQRWSGAEIRLDARTTVDPREYVQVDGHALQARLTERAAGARWVRAEARSRVDGGVQLADGSVVRAASVVDCSGAARVLGGGSAPSAFQTAYGLEIETAGHPWSPDRAVWMDLTDLQDPPSFLYVLPRNGTRVFVEETALAARPPIPLAALEIRLAQRLVRMGIEIQHVHAVERCRIPLDMPIPTGLAFGAAAGMVHPATGYLLSRVLAGARPFAQALSNGTARAEMARLSGGPARTLHLHGLDVLVGCDGAALSAFFERFFAMPAASREAFLSPQPQALATVLAMGRMFLGASLPLKRRLAAPFFSSRAPQPELACPHS